MLPVKRWLIVIVAMCGVLGAQVDLSASGRHSIRRPTKKESGCHPSYDPCVPIDVDVDCEGGKGDGPSYVRGPIRVIGPDVYDLDRDHDGIGCEPR
jgi:hypothetical protein